MARKKNAVTPRKVQPSISEVTWAQLEELVGLGYGGTPTEVARFLMQKSLDEILQSGLIGPGTKRRNVNDRDGR